MHVAAVKTRISTKKQRAKSIALSPLFHFKKEKTARHMEISSRKKKLSRKTF